MKVGGLKIKEAERDTSVTLMATFTRANFNQVKHTVRAFTLGKTEKFLMESGREE